MEKIPLPPSEETDEKFSLETDWPASLPLTTFFGLLLLLQAATLTTFAQNKEQPWGDSSVPLVYHVENTGSNFPAPTFPTFAKLPIIRPLPDPFRFADGFRDTSFPSWERRRNEILHAVEDNLLGPKPDCHDCTITASYAPNSPNALQRTLTVNVTRNGQTMSETAAITLPSSGAGPFPYIIGIEAAPGACPPAFSPMSRPSPTTKIK